MNERYFNLKYQVDAIDSAISKIEQHGGVIISDVVGLGKSIVASVVSYNLGLKTIIVAPPHLIEQWEPYRDDLKAQGIAFPKVLDPIPLTYDMGNLSQLYLDTLEKIAPDDEEKGFIGARYKPVIYLKDFKKYRDRITREFGEEQLFRQSRVPFDKGRRDATNKLLLIKEKMPHKKDYIEDLIFVIQKLDALPERFARMIRSLSLNKLDREFKDLEKAIPHRYLINIVNTAGKVEEGEECLIFAEEFI